jgi:hypothetical protein
MAATERSAISGNAFNGELLPQLTLMEMEQVSPLSEIVIPSQNLESISSPRLSRFLWASFNLLGMKSPTRTLALLMWYLHATTQGIAFAEAVLKKEVDECGRRRERRMIWAV